MLKAVKMKLKISLQERAKLGMEMLSRQPHFTSEEMLASVKRLHEGHSSNAKPKGKTKTKLK